MADSRAVVVAREGVEDDSLAGDVGEHKGVHFLAVVDEEDCRVGIRVLVVGVRYDRFERIASGRFFCMWLCRGGFGLYLYQPALDSRLERTPGVVACRGCLCLVVAECPQRSSRLGYAFLQTPGRSCVRTFMRSRRLLRAGRRGRGVALLGSVPVRRVGAGEYRAQLFAGLREYVARCGDIDTHFGGGVDQRNFLEKDQFDETFGSVPVREVRQSRVYRIRELAVDSVERGVGRFFQARAAVCDVQGAVFSLLRSAERRGLALDDFLCEGDLGWCEVEGSCDFALLRHVTRSCLEPSIDIGVDPDHLEARRLIQVRELRGEVRSQHGTSSRAPGMGGERRPSRDVIHDRTANRVTEALSEVVSGLG
ncbi:hypothetical protein ACW9HE_13010 [Nocardia gipuzkoensis]|uniref:hypothetical protein n=1 Tax=Nocardia abscessus TaxID=120957 RepID=UPI002458848F|nr:hypothetical protein [Nocardia abscessus]